MAKLKHMLQYSNDGLNIEKEIVIAENEDCLENLQNIIQYEYDLNNLHKCEEGYVSRWYKAEIKSLPFNRIFLKIEK